MQLIPNLAIHNIIRCNTKKENRFDKKQNFLRIFATL